MNRVNRILVCLFTLLSPSFLSPGLSSAHAQGRIAPPDAKKHGAPFNSFHDPLPKNVTLKAQKKTRAGGPTAQTVDLTPNTPLVNDLNAFWTKDEQTIFFQSNRKDLIGTQVGTLSHIYRMQSDGNGVSALTGPLSTSGIGSTSSQTEPASNPGTSAVTYIETDAGGGVDLFEYNLATNTARSILKNNPQGFNFVGLNHPEYGYAIGGNIGIIFSGKRDSDSSFHLFTVDTQRGIVTQLTTGAFDDRNPTLSPDPVKPVIAFDRGPAGGGTRDIYVIGTNSNIQNVTRVTQFTANGVPADNIEPAWSTNKVDQPQPGGNPIINGQQLLAFATTRFDSANDGNANSVNPNKSHDIYYLKVTIGPDPNAAGVFTITTPEDPNSNVALKLAVSDKQHIYDDRRPTWPQFINTYRVSYHSDRSRYDPIADANGLNPSGPAGQPNDIFSSTLLDVNAPTLVRFDAVSGTIVDVQPRIAAPGSTVTIQVKIADFETGVRDVWAQIKNPNSKYQSSDGLEHRVYFRVPLSPEGGNLSPFPVEFEFQRIHTGDYSYSDPPYISSVDDFFAFTGGANTPDPGWLQLQFASRDPLTGVATYKATWKTDNFPSDYIVDIIAYDNSVNPFGSGEQSNWKIYDNVWGFTTQTFQAAHNILFISDNGTGQKFFGSRFGNLALTNVFNTFWGTESWMTDIDTSLLPTAYVPKTGGTGGTLINVMNALGPRSYGSITDYFPSYDPLADDGTITPDGESVPATQQYDLWRVLCRGPVPDPVLQQYAAHTETQPPDTINGETQPRTVLVAPRCVIFHSPYTGSIFTGPGSLSDINVQNQLHNFLASGGRLFVNGQDVGWSLTLDGNAQNPFYTNDLRAHYVDDQIPGTSSIVRSNGGIPFVGFLSPIFGMTGSGQYNPITHDPWRNTNKTLTISPGHRYVGPPFPPGVNDYISNEPNWLVSGPDGPNSRDAGSPGVTFPDEITPLTGVISDMRYGNGNTAIQHYLDATTGQRVIYAACGIEGINPDAFVPPNTQGILALKNRRSELLHNMVCWMRTGTIFGTVRDVEAGNPLPNVLVRLTNKNTAAGAPIIAYTALTRDDGSYVINGVEADEYNVTAFKPGFTIQKRTGQQVHGGYRADMSFRMTKAEDAVIKGKVLRTDGVTPVIGATVTAKDNNDPNAKLLTATTDINGVYTLDRVPSQTTYTLTATAPGFGASIPVSYQVPNPNDPIASQRDTVVQPAKTYDGFDFQLKAQPGTVTGKVFANDINGNQVGPIANAVVTATFGSTTTKVTTVTDANGTYTFDPNATPANGLDAGSWTLVATAPGFKPNTGTTVVVISNQTVTAPDIRLDPLAPGSVSGLVTRTSDGAPLGGVLVVFKDASGNTIASVTTDDAATTGTGGYRYNFKINSIPAGATYTVTATKSGFTPVPVSRTVDITSGVEAQNVNFQMDPLHTFPGALSLVSTPYDYTNMAQNAAQLLSVSSGDPNFRFATWEAGRYIYFPTPPADKFRLGRGYFLGYTTNLPLSIQGTAADTTRPFDISLNPGWNMIGDPFTFDIDWTRIQIVDGATTLSYDQAVAAGIIGPSLYSYVSGTYILDFRLSPWKGYWVRSYKAVTLRIDPNTAGIGRAAAVAPAVSRAVLRGTDGWALNVRANVGLLRDEDNYLGVSSRAANGFDGFKSEKPPVFGDHYVYMTFDHDNWGDRSGGYGVDVRSASTATNTWEFSVQTTEANATATISIPNSATITRSVTLTLTDLATGQVRDLRTSGSYSWQTGDQPSTRRFRIDATRSAMTGPLRISGVGTRSGRGPNNTAVNINYTLNQTATVEVRILGIGGGVVRKLNTSATRAAGVNEVVWDGRTDKGSVVPAGAYQVEIKALASDGKSSARQITSLIVTR